MLARVIGWIAVGLPLLALPFSLLGDPVLSGFALWASLILAGVSSASRQGEVRTVLVASLICCAIGFFAAHYSPSAGLFAPTLQSTMGLIVMLTVPLAFAAACAAVGWLRRGRRVTERII
jgi:hypothetical protein